MNVIYVLLNSKSFEVLEELTSLAIGNSSFSLLASTLSEITSLTRKAFHFAHEYFLGKYQNCCYGACSYFSSNPTKCRQ